MTNYNPKSLSNLRPNFKRKWNDTKTKIIRVPVALSDEILDHAHRLDEGESIVTNDSELLNDLKKLVTKIDNKQSGYKSNSASKLINELKELINSYT